MSEIHEKAILEIKKMLEKEFNQKAIRSFRIARCHPDIMFKDGNDQYIVIEIGSIKERSILKYLRDPQIKETRWYSKQKELIGIWIQDKFNEVFYNPYRVFFKCPICERHKSCLSAKTERYAFGERIICSECHNDLVAHLVHAEEENDSDFRPKNPIKTPILYSNNRKLRQGWVTALRRNIYP